MITPHARVIITKEIREESAIPGDVGTIIEEYRATALRPELQAVQLPRRNKYRLDVRGSLVIEEEHMEEIDRIAGRFSGHRQGTVSRALSA
jgi:hypothetical protein